MSPMSFESPVLFLALLPLAPFLWFTVRDGRRGGVRLAIAACLAAALARPVSERVEEFRGPVVLARDVSLSVRPGELGAAAGERAVEFVDPAEGVARAAAEAGPGGAVRLATDARWDAGAVAAAQREAARAGVPVFRHPVPPGIPDAAPAAVHLSGPARAGEPAEIHALVRGDPGARGQALLLVDDAPAGRAPWTGPESRLRFPVTLAAGFHRFALRLEPEVDGDPRNNLALGGAEVAGTPRVLVVEGVAAGGEALVRALEAQQVECVRAAAGSAPDWDDFAAVVLARVDPAALGARGAELQAYVERGGGLLVVAGAEESAAWERDPLGAILPLDFQDPNPPSPDPGPKSGDPAPSDEAPRILLVLAIDRSGSMLGEKMLQAKEAALASARTLGEGDLVAVLAFDEEAHWVVEPTSATAAATLADRVSRLQAGGGTDVHAALVAVADRLVGLKIPVRHVVLMTDGQTPTADFRAQVERLAADGVTVSTVGLGAEFDGALLANIAGWGHGRFYFTERAGEIPRIFTAEARRAAAGAPAPRARPSPAAGPVPTRVPEFLPVVPVEPDPSLEGLDAWPDAGGACGREPRPGARLLLRAAQRPLLAVCRRSLGRVAAFAAPLDGTRGGKWTSWDRFPRFAAQAVRVLMRPEAAGPSIEIAPVGDSRRVLVRAPGAAEVRATLDGSPLVLEPRAGGVWEAVLPPGGFPSLRRLDAATPLGHSAAAVAWAFPEELSPRSALPLPFPDATGRALEERPAATRDVREEWQFLPLAAAVLLLLVEVWLRRVGS